MPTRETFSIIFTPKQGQTQKVGDPQAAKNCLSAVALLRSSPAGNALQAHAFSHSLCCLRFSHVAVALERGFHGPTPVSGLTFDELSGPLVHTDFP